MRHANPPAALGARSAKGRLRAASLALAASLSAVACGPGAAPAAKRAFAPDLSAQKPAPFPESALTSPLLAEGGPAACERLSALRAERPLARRWSFLGGLGVDSRGAPWMAVDVASSPFANVALGEDFQLDSLDGFLKAAEEARARGEVSDVQWGLILAARGAWKGLGIERPLREIQLRAVNGKVEAAFPGIFGDVGSPEKALPSLLVRKLDPSENLLADREAASAFLARANLFVDGEWSRFEEDVELSLGAAVRNYAFDPRQPASERACSFVLMERAFAQLVALKGFVGLRTEPVVGRPWTKTARLDAGHLSFDKRLRPGAFVETRSGARAVLSAERISAYDPAAGEGLRLARRAPVADSEEPGGSEPARLEDELAFLRSMALVYEATSPAAPWVAAPAQYMLGDVQSLESRAVVPDKMHALAAGLFVMTMKNLAAERLVPLAAGGRAARPGEDPSGLAAVAGSAGSRSVRLRDAVALIEAAAQMDEALKAFARPGVPRESWARLVPFYRPAALMALFGPILFTEAELRAAGASGSSLKHGLDRLKLPLAALALRLLDSGAAEVEWDPAAGFGRPLARIAPADVARAKAALLRLAANAQSTALAERARRL